MYAQNTSLASENAFMKCVYSALPDEGAKFKQLLDAAEQRLIELNYLQNTKGESYVNIFKNIKSLNDERLKDLGIASYMSEISNRINTPESEACMSAVFQNPAFQDSKFAKMMKVVQQVSAYEDNESLTADILRILDPEDFTHNYYRMTTISMIETMNQKSNVQQNEKPQFVTDADLTEYEIKNTLYIEVTDDNKILVNQKVASLEELHEKIADYLREYEAENVIALKSSKNASSDFLMKVQNKLIEGFSLIRNRVAIEKYSSDFAELRPILQKEISETYPIRIKKMNSDE
jgi:biopolymer transport protein ExbD